MKKNQILNKIFIQNSRLYNLKTRKDLYLQEHLSEVNILAAIRKNIDEIEKKLYCLICSTIESWNTLIMNISEGMELSYESIKAMLLVEESHRKTNIGGPSNDVALVAHYKFIKSDDNSKNQDRLETQGRKKNVNVGIMERKVI